MKQSRLAQRKLGEKKIEHKPARKRKKIWKFILIFALAVVIVGVLFFIFGSRAWDGHSKITSVYQKMSGDASIVVLDPGSLSIVTFDVPSQTEVQAARQLGTWKIGSISRLGEDKKISGDFLKNTIIKSFNFPIDEEADESFGRLTSGNLLSEIGAVVGGQSDFSLVDRIKIALFSLQIADVSRFDINLSNTSELERAFLSDGSLGWKVNENTPTNIESYFVIGDLENKNYNVLINNGTGSNLYSSLVGKVAEMIGVNVASIQILPTTDFDCSVMGQSHEAVDKIARIFSCGKVYGQPANNFDVRIDIGKKFKTRF